MGLLLLPPTPICTGTCWSSWLSAHQLWEQPIQCWMRLPITSPSCFPQLETCRRLPDANPKLGCSEQWLLLTFPDICTLFSTETMLRLYQNPQTGKGKRETKISSKHLPSQQLRESQRVMPNQSSPMPAPTHPAVTMGTVTWGQGSKQSHCSQGARWTMLDQRSSAARQAAVDSVLSSPPQASL